MGRKSRRRSYGVALGMVMGLCTVAGAEEQAAGTKEGDARLEQIVVTATRTEKSVDNAPGSVSVITREEMDKRNITTADEALNATAGVLAIRGKGLMDRRSAVTLRGIPSQSRTLVMQDGITLNTPSSGTLLWLGVSPDSLDRIEVVKGPFSSLYGGYAMGGVINMITKMPEKREITVKTGYGNAMFGGDAPENTYRISTTYGDSFKNGKFRIFINNDYLTTDGYRSDIVTSATKPPATQAGWSPATDVKGAPAYILGDKGQNGTWQDNFTLKLAYAPTADTSARFTFLKSTGGYSYDFPQTYLRDTTTGAPVWAYGSAMAGVSQGSFLGITGGNDIYQYNLGVDTKVATTQIKFNAGYMDQASFWSATPSSSGATLNGGAGTFTDGPGAAVTADLQATTPLFDRHLLTVGTSFRTAWADSTENALANWQDHGAKGALNLAAGGSDRTYAVFAQGEIALLDSLTAYVGVREDWWETYDGYSTVAGSPSQSFGSRSDSAFSPKGALVYKPFERTAFRASVGQAFRAPTVSELYQTLKMGSTGIQYVGNANLKPETTTSWDISVEQKFDHDAKIKVTYFENYIKDMIYTTTSYTGTGMNRIYNRLNAGKAESKGVELETEIKPLHWLKLFANYTYTDSTVKENSAAPGSVGKRMTDVPEHMFNAGADVEYGPFGGYLLGRYVGKRYASDDNSDTAKGVPGAYDPYFTLDLKLRYKLTSWATASLAVNNLLDEQYYSYYKAPGRSWFGEVTFSF